MQRNGNVKNEPGRMDPRIHYGTLQEKATRRDYAVAKHMQEPSTTQASPISLQVPTVDKGTHTKAQPIPFTNVSLEQDISILGVTKFHYVLVPNCAFSVCHSSDLRMAAATLVSDGFCEV